KMSWQASWWVMAALVAGVFMPLVLVLVKRDSPFQFNLEEQRAQAQALPASNGNVSRGEVLRRPSFYLLNLVSLFPPFFLTGIIINKGLIGEANGWSEEWLALGLSVFGLTRLVANVIGGPLIDHFTAVRVFSFMLIPLMIGTLLLTLSDHPWIVIGFFLASGITASLNGLASTATWAELYGTRYLGAIRSMASTFMVFSTAAAPLALGWALDQPGQENVTMLGACLLMLILTLAAFWQVRRLKLA
ncbi:MAG: MFS transporter, partial [Bacteroidota bacterium]